MKKDATFFICRVVEGLPYKNILWGKTRAGACESGILAQSRASLILAIFF